jgi:hypothetical protein
VIHVGPEPCAVAREGLDEALTGGRIGQRLSRESTLQMKRGPSFTIVALLSLLASVTMARDNNWSGAAFGCVAAGCLFFMAIV